MRQAAVDIGYDKMFGTLKLDELNDLLRQGWTVATIEASSGGDILVIVEKEENGTQNQQ